MDVVLLEMGLWKCFENWDKDGFIEEVWISPIQNAWNIILFLFLLFLLYNTVLVLPYIDMNQPRVHMSSTFSLSSFTFIKRLFSSSSLSP